MNKTLKTSGVALLLALTMSACSSTRKVPYQARWNAPFTYVDAAAPDGLDPQSRLRYGIINDGQYLYITLKTKDPNTVKQILTNGLRLTFSAASRRSEERSLVFPVVSRDDKRALQKMQLDLPNSLALSRMMEAFNKEALWKDRQGERFINLVDNQTGIRARLTMDENQELTQQINVPFERLGIDATQEPSMELSIKTEGTGGLGSGISPNISIGGGGFGGGFGGGGFGGGGVSIGTGRGGNNPNERTVNFTLQVQLARDSFQQDLR